MIVKIKKVAVDFDGVVGALDVPWVARYNKDWNDTMKVEDILDWDIHKFVKPECGMKMYEYIEDPTIYDDVLPVEGAIRGIQALRDMGYELSFVTHSTKGHAGRKRKWLYDWNILHSDFEYFEMRDKSNFPAFYLLDDYTVNVSNFKGVGILFTAPYNKSSTIRPRVNNWVEAVRFFQKEL